MSVEERPSIVERITRNVRSRLTRQVSPSQAKMDLARKQEDQDLQLILAVNWTDYLYLQELLAVYRTREASPSLYKRGPVALEDDNFSEAGRWLQTAGFQQVFIDEVLTSLNHPLPEKGQLVVEFLSSQPQKRTRPKNPILLVEVPKLDPRKWRPYEITVRLYPKDYYALRFLDSGLVGWWHTLERPIYIPGTQPVVEVYYDRDHHYVNEWRQNIFPTRTRMTGRELGKREPVDKPTIRAVIGKPHQWWQISFGTPFAPTDKPTKITSATTDIDPAIPCDLEDPQLQLVELDLTTQKVTVSTYKYPTNGTTKFLSGERVEHQKAKYDIEGSWLVSSGRKTEPLVFEEFANRWFSIPIRDFTS